METNENWRYKNLRSRWTNEEQKTEITKIDFLWKVPRKYILKEQFGMRLRQK